MTKTEMLNAVEKIERTLDPKAKDAIFYARMYGTLLAHITDEQAETILEFAKKRLDKSLGL